MPNRDDENMREAIRVAKFEVDTVDGADWKETTQRWFATMDLCRRASNLYYETWLAWHVQNQSSLKIEKWLENRKVIGVKEAGKCPVECIKSPPKGLKPKGSDRLAYLTCVLYDNLTNRYPSLNASLVTLLMQTLRGSLTSGKAASGSLPKWTSILLHNEGMPMFTKREYPIPFGRQTSTLITDGADRYVEIESWRMPVAGKATNIVVTDKIRIRTTGKRCRDHAKKFDKISSGEWKFKGSELVYDAKCGKWMLLLCHQCPSRVASVDQSKTAYLLPSRKVPFLVKTRGVRPLWLQGRGGHITATRERVWAKRSEMNVGSRKTMTLRNGHGRKAASKWRAKWATTWRYFVMRVNHQVSHDAVDWCVTNGVGTLVYLKPNGRTAETRFVSGNFKNSTWEFFDLGTKLAYKCQERGITLKVIECGKSSGPVLGETSEPLATSEVTNCNEVTPSTGKGVAKGKPKTNRKK